MKVSRLSWPRTSLWAAIAIGGAGAARDPASGATASKAAMAANRPARRKDVRCAARGAIPRCRPDFAIFSRGLRLGFRLAARLRRRPVTTRNYLRGVYLDKRFDNGSPCPKLWHWGNRRGKLAKVAPHRLERNCSSSGAGEIRAKRMGSGCMEPRRAAVAAGVFAPVRLAPQPFSEADLDIVRRLSAPEDR